MCLGTFLYFGKLFLDHFPLQNKLIHFQKLFQLVSYFLEERRQPKISHAARELATVFSVAIFVSNNRWSIGQNAPPPNRRCLGTSLKICTMFFVVALFLKFLLQLRFPRDVSLISFLLFLFIYLVRPFQRAKQAHSFPEFHRILSDCF